MGKFDNPENFGKKESSGEGNKKEDVNLTDAVADLQNLDELYEVLRKTETIQSDASPEYKFNTESIIEYLNSIRRKTAPDKLVNSEILEHLEKLGIGNKIIELLKKEYAEKEKIAENKVGHEDKEEHESKSEGKEKDSRLDALKMESVDDFLKVFESFDLLNEEIGKEEKEKIILEVTGAINEAKDDDFIDLALAKGIKKIKKIVEEIIREKDKFADDFQKATVEALELLNNKKMSNGKKAKINEEVLDLISQMKKNVSLGFLKEGIKKIKEIVAEIKRQDR